MSWRVPAFKTLMILSTSFATGDGFDMNQLHCQSPEVLKARKFLGDMA
jgi:hypothetical protein